MEDIGIGDIQFYNGDLNEVGERQTCLTTLSVTGVGL